MQFTGYASVFGGVDSYGDTIMPGAYAKTISDGHLITLDYQHYEGVIGKIVEIKEDETGLLMTGELTPGHSLAQDAYALLKHGAINGLSIGYRPVEWKENDAGNRELHEIELDEVSIVSRPADNEARIGDVKFKDLFEIHSLADAEQILRDSGMFSRKTSTQFVSKIKQLLTQSDSDGDAASQIRAITARLQSRNQD